ECAHSVVVAPTTHTSEQRSTIRISTIGKLHKVTACTPRDLSQIRISLLQPSSGLWRACVPASRRSWTSFRKLDRRREQGILVVASQSHETPRDDNRRTGAGLGSKPHGKCGTRQDAIHSCFQMRFVSWDHWRIRITASGSDAPYASRFHPLCAKADS